jgi:hypothetical protein
MWGELPKLFGKAFAIGFFLPSAAIILSFLGVFATFGYYDAISQFLKSVTNDWIGATLSVFALWMGGVLLMALNRGIIRFFEGYNRFNPWRLLRRGKQRQFAQLDAAIDALRQERAEAELKGTRWSAASAARYRQLMAKYTDYPDSAESVLPTRFGNAIRSFEVYSRVIYGLEAIDAWPRLLAVITPDYRQAIDDAKAQMDFWVNIWAGTFLVILLYVVLALVTRGYPHPWIPLVAVVIALVAAGGARALVGEWGGLVMSAFDLFRGDLCKKLGLKMPATIGEEREMWTLLSQMMGYRNREVADRLSRFRDSGAPPSH